MKTLVAFLLALCCLLPACKDEGPETQALKWEVASQKADMREWGGKKDETILVYDIQTTIPPDMRVYVGLRDAKGKLFDGIPRDGSLSRTDAQGRLAGYFMDAAKAGDFSGPCQLELNMAFDQEEAQSPGYKDLHGQFIGKDGNKRKTFTQHIPLTFEPRQ